MRIGVCTGDFSVSAEGLDFLETTAGALLCPLESEEVFAQRLAEAPASRGTAYRAPKAVRPPAPVSCPPRSEAVNQLFPRDMPVTGPAVDVAKVDEYVRTVCRRAARAGVKIIVFGSGGSRRVPEGFSRATAAEQIVGHLRRWGPVAADCGVTIVLEPLNQAECNIVNTVDEGAELVRAAGQPSIRLLADTYHMLRDGEGPDSIRRSEGLIVHVHCADPQGRQPPGLAGGDHRAYLRALKDIGYQGRVCIEAKFADLRRQLAQALEALKRQIDQA